MIDISDLHSEIEAAFSALSSPRAVETWLTIRTLLAEATREESEQRQSAVLRSP